MTAKSRRKDASPTDLAREYAAANGESNPSNLQVVRTTRQAGADLVDGAQLETNEDAYLIQLNGSFTGDAGHRPAGMAAPTGNAMTLTVDAATGEVLDWGITDTPHDLSILGEVTTLS